MSMDSTSAAIITICGTMTIGIQHTLLVSIVTLSVTGQSVWLHCSDVTGTVVVKSGGADRWRGAVRGLGGRRRGAVRGLGG